MWSSLQTFLGEPQKAELIITNDFCFWQMHGNEKGPLCLEWKPLKEKFVLQVPSKPRKVNEYTQKEFKKKSDAAKEALVAFYLSKRFIFPEFGSLWVSSSKSSFSMKAFPKDMFYFCQGTHSFKDLKRVVRQITRCVADLAPRAHVFMLDLKPANVVINEHESKLIDGDPEFVVFLGKRMPLHYVDLLSAANIVLFYLQFWGHAGLLYSSNKSIRFYRTQLRFRVREALLVLPIHEETVLKFLVSFSLSMHNARRSGRLRRRSPLCTVFTYLVSPQLKVEYSFLSFSQQDLLFKIRRSWFRYDREWGKQDETKLLQLFKDLFALVELGQF